MTPQKTSKVVDLTCDLLALSDILPSKEKLTDFKLNSTANGLSTNRDILNQSVINEDLYAELVEYVQQALYKTAMQRFHRGFRYTLFRRFNTIS